VHVASRGSLARYRYKLEHQPVLKGPPDRDLLAKLVRDGVLCLEENFYHWVPERAATLVGVTWHQLRSGEISPKLTKYLQEFVQSRN